MVEVEGRGDEGRGDEGRGVGELGFEMITDFMNDGGEDGD